MYQLSDIRITRQQRTLLSIEKLSLPTNQIIAILGRNGAGKSTLLKVLAGQLQPDQGDIHLHQKPLADYDTRRRAQQIALMPQQLSTTGDLRVDELVLLGRYAWRGNFQRWQAQDHQICREAMQQTDIAHLAHQPLTALSGGERQRAWLAMLLAQQAPLLLLDEPNAALDLSHQYALLDCLLQLNQQRQQGVIMILHDVNLALRYAQRLLVLHQGQLWFDGSPQALLDLPQLDELYGIPLQQIPHPAGKTPFLVVP